MFSKEEKVKISVELTSYIILTWLSFFILRGLNFKLIDMFHIDKLLYLFQSEMMTIITILLIFGLATSILLISLRHFSKRKSIRYAFLFSLIGSFPGFFLFEESTFYIATLIAYILSITYVGSHIIHEREDNWHHSFHIGWQYMRKIALITAVGAFIGSFVFVQININSYENGLTSIIQSISKSNSLSLSKDQIRSMVDIQNEFELKQDDFRDLVNAIYAPLTVDEYITLTYPNYDQLSSEEQRNLRENLRKTLNNPEYLQKQQELREKKAKQMYQNYQSQIRGIMNEDKIVDQIYNNMRSDEYQKRMGELSQKIIMDMPIFNELFALLPILVGFTVFSFLILMELLSSFMAGLIFIIHYHLYKKRVYW